MPDATSSDRPPSKPVLIVLTLGMAVLGLLMLLQGLGIVSNRWLNPNPDAPQWLFGVIGAILILACILTAGTIAPLPRRIANATGYTLVALAWLVTHWLVFFSTGGECGAETGGLALTLPAIACRGLMGLAVIGLDVILLAALYATLRPSRRT